MFSKSTTGDSLKSLASASATSSRFTICRSRRALECSNFQLCHRQRASGRPAFSARSRGSLKAGSWNLSVHQINATSLAFVTRIDGSARIFLSSASNCRPRIADGVAPGRLFGRLRNGPPSSLAQKIVRPTDVSVWPSPKVALTVATPNNDALPYLVAAGTGGTGRMISEATFQSFPMRSQLMIIRNGLAVPSCPA